MRIGSSFCQGASPRCLYGIGHRQHRHHQNIRSQADLGGVKTLGMGRWLWFHNTPTVGCADDIRFIIRDNLKDYIIFLDPLVLKCTVPLFKTYPDQPDHIQHVLALLTPSVIFLLSSGQIETCFVLPLWLQLNWISMALTELHKNKIARLPLLYSLYSLRSCYLYCPSFSFVDH